MYEVAVENANSSLRMLAKRLRDPDTLTSAEFQALLKELASRERLMVLIAGSTGLRCGELIGLRWSDIDFERDSINLTRSIWQNLEGQPKTAASRKPVPIPKVLPLELKGWKKSALYNKAGDFLFLSLASNGRHPVRPDMILKDHIRPVLKRLEIDKRIGRHSFRHGFSNLLRQTGADIKTTQELLRHASSRVTLDT